MKPTLQYKTNEQKKQHQKHYEQKCHCQFVSEHEMEYFSSIVMLAP